jgi:hypothetical protein
MTIGYRFSTSEFWGRVHDFHGKNVIAAVLLFVGLFLGMVGTYLMTSAYHPFSQAELLGNFAEVCFRVLTFRWKSAWDLVRAVARAARTLKEEKKELSLAGIYFLFLSFIIQLVSAAFAIWDLCHKAPPQVG